MALNLIVVETDGENTMAMVSDRLLGIAKPTFITWLTKFIENRQEHHEMAKAEAELQALDDRMLADIGVVRCDIKNAVRTKFVSRWR